MNERNSKVFDQEAKELLKNEVENYEGTLMAMSASEAAKLGSSSVEQEHVREAAAKLSGSM